MATGMERPPHLRHARAASGKRKLYVLDMFPYPSGDGLHVGHPEGYTATDIVCRFNRMRGKHVLHRWVGTPSACRPNSTRKRPARIPRTTTYKNIDTFRRQLQMLGFSYDWDREFSTTDPDYFRWTQWIFLVLFDTWFDRECEWIGADGRKRKGRGRPIAELPIPDDIREQGTEAVRRYQDKHRLAYQSFAAGQLVLRAGNGAGQRRGHRRQERAGRPSRHASLRCGNGCSASPNTPTACWRNWTNWIGASRSRRCSGIGSAAAKGPKSISSSANAAADRRRAGTSPHGNETRTGTGFPKEPANDVLRIYTTRPDTLFGATYMVLAPEHPFVDRLTTARQKAGRRQISADGRRQRAISTEPIWRSKRRASSRGPSAFNPRQRQEIPIWIADYVLGSYGTGAIMAVPAHDLRDWEFAVQFNLPIIPVVQPPAKYEPSRDEMALARTVDGRRRRRLSDRGRRSIPAHYNGTPTAAFKKQITQDLEKSRTRPRRGQLPFARLAVQPAALLGRAVSRSGTSWMRAGKADRACCGAMLGERTARHACPR